MFKWNRDADPNALRPIGSLADSSSRLNSCASSSSMKLATLYVFFILVEVPRVRYIVSRDAWPTARWNWVGAEIRIAPEGGSNHASNLPKR